MARTYVCIFDTRTYSPYVRAICMGSVYWQSIYMAHIYGCTFRHVYVWAVCTGVKNCTHIHGPYLLVVHNLHISLTGRSRSSAMTNFNRPYYDFSLVFLDNYILMLYCFWDTSQILIKPLTCHMLPVFGNQWRWPYWNFAKTFHAKTRIMGGEKHLMISLANKTQSNSVTDGWAWKDVET